MHGDAPISLTWLDVSNNALNEDCGCEIAESLKRRIEALGRKNI